MKNSDAIPVVGTAAHKILSEQIYSTETYQNTLEMGRPFFTKDEIQEIEKKYPEGMTWKQIEKEISKKGLIIKKPTFRKYVNEKWVPEAITQTSGREHIYPNTAIKSVNLVKFLLSIDGKNIFNLLDALNTEYGASIYELLEESSYMDLQNDVRVALSYYLAVGIPDIESAIEKDLDFKKAVSGETCEEIKEKLNSYLKRMSEKYNKYIEPEIDGFVDYAKSKHVKININDILQTIISKI